MAAQPPRPPPNNVLFCGPPPALPRVVLLPTGAARDLAAITPQRTEPGYTQTNDADRLSEINNVGVPTYEGLFEDQVESSTFQTDLNADQILPSDGYLRRTQSFDISEMYAGRFENDIDARALQHRHSEPDLSKFGLFVEAEVTMECGPLQPPPLVLNNPFYDGSYAIDPNQLNQSMVVLPENYLAFEDSFVPWKYKPDFLNNSEINPDLYYDGLPLIPSNDPWSAVYGNENAAFDYYSPQYVTPIGEHEGIRYMPLADFEYAIPQYMSLPSMEQPNFETFDNNYQSEETATPSAEATSDNNQCVVTSSQPEIVSDLSVSSAVNSNVLSEDEKVYTKDLSTNRELSIQSEGSLNADISYDVTSSLAFVPNSKSSQIPHGADDTSDDTSPSSIDYHEASALDLVQSLDELSCCDSTDLSQSKEESSPTFPETPKPFLVVENDLSEGDGPYVLASNKTLVNVPLSKLPSIPIHDRLPKKQSPVPHSLPNEDSTTVNSPPLSHKKQEANAFEAVLPLQTEAKQNKVNDRSSETPASDNSVNVNTSGSKVPPPSPPHPPAVPTSWLASKPPNREQEPSGVQVTSLTNVVQATPQIRVQNIEGRSTDFEKSPKPPSQPPVKKTNQTVEPQPSCSYVPPQAPQPTTQLKPKEVEVSFLSVTK